jgi:hypothetical protein
MPQIASSGDAIALLDGGKQGSIAAFEYAPARHDHRAAALGQKLLKRQFEAFLATVSGNGGMGIARGHQRRDPGRADATRPRLT